MSHNVSDLSTSDEWVLQQSPRSSRAPVICTSPIENASVLRENPTLSEIAFVRSIFRRSKEGRPGMRVADIS